MAKRIEFSNEEIKKIIQLYKDEPSFKKIALKFSVSPPTIKKILQVNNIAVCTAPPKLNFNSDQIQNIIDLYNKNWSLKKIAIYYNISRKSITKLLKINNIQLRSKQEQTRINNKNRISKFSSNNEQIICQLYINKNSLSKIGKLFGSKRSTIKKIIMKYNINIRKTREYLIKYTNERAFDQIISHEQAYWLGFIAADGNINLKHNCLSIELAGKDKKHLEKFYKFMCSTSKILFTPRIDKQTGKQRDYYKVSFSSADLISDLLKHNITPKKSFTLQLPNTLPEYLLASYILGYFDGDGSIGYYHKCLQMDIISSYAACRQIQIILMKYSFIKETKLYPLGPVCSFQYHGNLQVPRIMEYLYSNVNLSSDVYLERKRAIYDKFLKDREVIKNGIK